MKHISVILPLLVMALLAGACNEAANKPPQLGTLVVRVADAPGDYQEVNITFKDIDVHMNGGWISIVGDQRQTVNLLEWNNGKSFELGRQDIAPGKVTQIRLLVEEGSVVVDNQTHPLDISNLVPTGLKLNTNFDIVAGSTYELVLDFVIEHSIVETGSDKYKLKPVVRVSAIGTTGSVSGVVDNNDANPGAAAWNTDGLRVLTTIPDPVTGAFTLAFLPPGEYSISIRDDLGRWHGEDVTVVAGQNIDLGNITLN